MRLPQANAPINEQGIVGQTGVFACLDSRSLGQLVTLAFNKIRKNEIRIEATYHRALRRPHNRRDTNRRGFARTDLDDHLCAATCDTDQLNNSFDVVLLKPVDNETIGSQKAQARAVLDRLQRPYPGIELLLWQLRLKITDATIPETVLGLQGSPKDFLATEKVIDQFITSANP